VNKQGFGYGTIETCRYPGNVRWGATLADPHQVNSIIATAICDCRKDCPSGGMDPEEAKQIAKCIVAALTDAGLEIVPASRNSCDR